MRCVLVNFAVTEFLVKLLKEGRVCFGLLRVCLRAHTVRYDGEGMELVAAGDIGLQSRKRKGERGRREGEGRKSKGGRSEEGKGGKGRGRNASDQLAFSFTPFIQSGSLAMKCCLPYSELVLSPQSNYPRNTLKEALGGVSPR